MLAFARICSGVIFACLVICNLIVLRFSYDFVRGGAIKVCLWEEVEQVDEGEVCSCCGNTPGPRLLFIIFLFSFVLIPEFSINLSSSATWTPNVPSQSAAGRLITTDISCNKSSVRFSRGSTVCFSLRLFAGMRGGEKQSKFSLLCHSDMVDKRFAVRYL